MNYVEGIVSKLERINSNAKEKLSDNEYVKEINYELRQTSRFINSIRLRYSASEEMFELPMITFKGDLTVVELMYLIRDEYSKIENDIVLNLTEGLGESVVLELLTIYSMLGRLKCIAQNFTDMQHCIERIGEVDIKEISKSNCAKVS